MKKNQKTQKKDQKTWFFISFTYVFHSYVPHSVSFSRFDTIKGLSDYLIKIFKQPKRRCGKRYGGLYLSVKKIEKLRVLQLGSTGRINPLVKFKKQLKKDCYFIDLGISSALGNGR